MDVKQHLDYGRLDVLTQNVTNYLSPNLAAFTIDLKSDRYLGSSAAKMTVEFQNDTTDLRRRYFFGSKISYHIVNRGAGR